MNILILFIMTAAIGFLLYKHQREAFSFFLVTFGVGAWLTHVLFCFGANAWGMLLAGALVIPLGILHGIYIWFQ